MPKFTAGQHAFNNGDPYIPNGTYDFRVESVDRRERGTPKEYLNIRFRLMNHPEHKGKVYSENFSLTIKSIWKVEKLLMAAGLPAGAEYDTDDDDAFFPLFLGKLVRLRLMTQTTDRGTKQGIANNGFASATEGETPDQFNTGKESTNQYNDNSAEAPKPATRSSVKSFLQD